MGQLESEFQFTGRLGNVTAYRMRGVDKIIVRTKGGASKKRILNDRCFVRTRENNAEFGGRARGVRRVRLAIAPLIPLADYNFAGHINKVLMYFQDRDAVNERGKRSILFSQYGALLEGFSLNRHTTLDSLIRTPLTYDISRKTLTAKVNIPELVPGINFFPPQKHPLFQVMAVLSIVPDLFIKDEKYEPSNEKYDLTPMRIESSTPWTSPNHGLPATGLELQIPSAPPDHAGAFMLSIGVRFGVPDGERVAQTKHAGCARIMSVVSISDPTALSLALDTRTDVFR